METYLVVACILSSSKRSHRISSKAIGFSSYLSLCVPTKKIAKLEPFECSVLAMLCKTSTTFGAEAPSSKSGPHHFGSDASYNMLTAFQLDWSPVEGWRCLDECLGRHYGIEADHHCLQSRAIPVPFEHPYSLQ